MTDTALLPGAVTPEPHPDAPSSPEHLTDPVRSRPPWMPGLWDAVRRRRFALCMAAVVVVVGILYTFFWDLLVYGNSSWVDPSDMWGVFRGAHYVGWGYLGGVYNQDTGMVTFPGIAVLLAPAAVVSDWLHLSASIPLYALPHPTAQLLVSPLEIVFASTAVVGADALADALGASRSRRRWSVVAVAVVAWPTACVWGHAEDALVMTFFLYAMVAVLRGNWRRAGWLLGIGIVIQPLIALTVPVFLASTPRGGRLWFAVRCSVVSAFLVGVAVAGNPRDAYRALVQQPTPPAMNHPTPWVALAPHLRIHSIYSGDSTISSIRGSHLFRSVGVATQHQLQVSGGTGRTIYVVLALLLGLYVWRRPQPPVRLLWVAALVLAGRCCFEAVMTPYYLAPPLILLLVLAARTDARRLAGSIAVALGISWFAYWRFSPWVWWTPIVCGLVALLALTYPADPALPSGSGPSAEPDGARRRHGPDEDAGHRSGIGTQGGPIPGAS